MKQTAIQKDKKYFCTECGVESTVRYSNWSKTGVKKKIVGRNESLCHKCFKERIEKK